MAKGAIAKQEITQKILENFQGAFTHEKEIRIPWIENNEQVEIKVTLTCAKVNVGSTIALGGNGSSTQSLEMTDAEKENIRILIEQLGL